MEKLAHDLAETARALGGKIKSLDEHAARELHNLREHLLEQSKALTSEIREKPGQMMLSGVAFRLTNEFRVPGA